ncbi:hypothetical protein Tsubulata_024124 [Turnera subulata]|uniref:DUF4283 domain-containing protein n=1 Tax=Turnera subulata TaxID=218843 RepID=A0A9Q0FWW7_9ROSI|nr:hypothetical protein Tsubulata_024124 [Turnera subulata]
MQGKSFAQSVRAQLASTKVPISGVCNGISKLVYIPLDETVEWLSRCVFGLLTTPLERFAVEELFRSNGVDVVVSDLGGDATLIHFSSVKGRDLFLSELPEWIEKNFQLFKAWQLGDKSCNRKCWIQLKGVPLEVWCHNFFCSASRRFGDLIKVAEVTENKVNLESAFIQVLTSVKQSMSEEFHVNVKGTKSIIKCTEVPASTIPAPSTTVVNHLDDLLHLESTPSGHRPLNTRDKSPAVEVDGGDQPIGRVGKQETQTTRALGSDPFHLMEVIENHNEPMTNVQHTLRESPIFLLSSNSNNMGWQEGSA